MKVFQSSFWCGQKMAAGVGTWTELFKKFDKNMFYYTDGTDALSPYESYWKPYWKQGHTALC